MHPTLSNLHAQEIRRRQAERAAEYELYRLSQENDETAPVHTETPLEPKQKNVLGSSLLHTLVQLVRS